MLAGGQGGPRHSCNERNSGDEGTQSRVAFCCRFKDAAATNSDASTEDALRARGPALASSESALRFLRGDTQKGSTPP